MQGSTISEDDLFKDYPESSPEFSKLHLLNHFISLETMNAEDKILLIYEKILEELSEGCHKNKQIVELEKQL